MKQTNKSQIFSLWPQYMYPPLLSSSRKYFDVFKQNPTSLLLGWSGQVTSDPSSELNKALIRVWFVFSSSLGRCLSSGLSSSCIINLCSCSSHTCWAGATENKNHRGENSWVLNESKHYWSLLHLHFNTQILITMFFLCWFQCKVKQVSRYTPLTRLVV